LGDRLSRAGVRRGGGARGSGQGAEACAAGPRRSARAYVPEIRGQQRARAEELLAAAGLALDEEADEIIGSVWAPDRIMFTTPEVGSDVPKVSTVKIGITGDWLTGPAVPDEKTAW